MIRVLIFKPDKTIEETQIENSLTALQEAVGGRIEAFRLTEDTCLICNEAGMLLNLDTQFILGHLFYGPVVMVGVDGENFTSLTDGVCEILGRRFKCIS